MLENTIAPFAKLDGRPRPLGISKVSSSNWQQYIGVIPNTATRILPPAEFIADHTDGEESDIVESLLDFIRISSRDAFKLKKDSDPVFAELNIHITEPADWPTYLHWNRDWPRMANCSQLAQYKYVTTLLGPSTRIVAGEYAENIALLCPRMIPNADDEVKTEEGEIMRLKIGQVDGAVHTRPWLTRGRVSLSVNYGSETEIQRCGYLGTSDSI